MFRPAKAETTHRAQTRRSLFRSSSSSLKAPPLISSTSSAALGSLTVLQSEYTASEEDPNLKDLNNSLSALAAIFPDVRPEVFREMLQSFDEQSRLHVVAEQMLKHKAEWVKGRWRVPSTETPGATSSQETGSENRERGSIVGRARSEDELVPVEERFRSDRYKTAARATLYQEFRGLSRSTVDAVLAEHNYFYTAARPTLMDIAAKSWRMSFSTFFFRRKRSTDVGLEKHPMMLWERASGGDLRPVLRETGCKELDSELYRSLLEPLLRRKLEEQEAGDRETALQLNEEQAQQAEALYECECCFSDTTFEQMATCDTGCHTICFRCIRQAVSEALFGQGWGRNMDHERGQVRCLAPMVETGCEGCLPQALTQRAVEEAKGGTETWRKLDERLAEEALLKSRAKLVRCPFCAYAEIDDIYLPPTHRRWRLRRRRLIPLLVTLILFMDLLPFLLLLATLYTTLTLLFPSTPLLPLPTLLTTSLTTLLARTHRSPKFTCRHPSCLRASCLHCAKPWHDVHACAEPPHALSLRTTVEAARTAALKRTCPRCALAFVKASGCNKLTCPCGYQMCYLCRKGLSNPPTPLRVRRLAAAADGDDDDDGRARNRERGGGGGGGEEAGQGGEGYRHFCNHFRVSGGRCDRCERCDLYKAEDEDVVVRRAGERAEREWRVREGMVGVLVNGTVGVGMGMGMGEGEGEGWWEWGWEWLAWVRGCTVQGIVDCVVGALVECG